MFSFRRKKRIDSENEQPLSELAKKITASELFDPEYYLLRNPDLETYHDGPLAHFMRHGMAEGREASPHFDARIYIQRHPAAGPDAASAFMYAMEHLDGPEHRLLWSRDDEKSLAYLLEKSGLFDPDWYLARYADVRASAADPLAHFVTRGSRELRDPSADFDSRFYRGQHPEYIESFASPIEYYLRLGYRHRDATACADPYGAWTTRFDDLTASDRATIAQDCSAFSGQTLGVHILDIPACEDIGRILESWREQILVPATIRFVASPDVPAALWAACEQAIAAYPGASVRSPADALADAPDDTIVLLCGGPARLRPHANYAFAQALSRSSARAAYSDHDRMSRSGVRSEPIFKPAMSPELMRRRPYAGDVVAAILDGDSRSALEGAVALAATETARRSWARYLLRLRGSQVKRVPLLLFHVAEPVDGSTDAASAPDAGDAAANPATDPASDRPTVEIVIPSRDHRDLLAACIGSIETATDYPAHRYAITVVDNGSTEEAALAYLDDLRRQPGRHVVPSPGPFNFSVVCNEGAASTRAEILVFLNNDTTVREPGWLDALVEQARKPDVGIVGAQLLYPDETIQHGGVVLGVQGVGAHRLVGVPAALAAKSDLTREMVSVTGACLAVRNDVFRQLGGFDPALQIAFGDVDLCARSHLAGYRNIYVAQPLLYHHESKSRGLDDTRAKQSRNDREAVYVRSRYQALFRDDPSYSPNLSLDRIDHLALPPRVVRPWRRSPSGRRRILLLSRTHELGHGVATVLGQQAMVFRRRGWDVLVGGRPGKREIAYPGCRRVLLWDSDDAAAFAVEEGIDCVIVHTPPFFSIVRHLGKTPLIYFYDHGEPNPGLFPDAARREAIDWEKRFCAPLAVRVFAISKAIYEQQFRSDTIVLRNGNDHLARWSEDDRERRRRVRDDLGLAGHFVVLNVCRFGEGERYYKGIDRYGYLSQDVQHLHPELAGKVRFVIAGRGEKADVDHCRSLGLTVFANVSDEEMIGLYLASDLYVSLSEWEGYNLGIAQARSLGLPVLASAISAHREFGVATSDSMLVLCALVAARFAEWDETRVERNPVLEPWHIPLTRLAETIEEDQERASQTIWD